MIVWIAEQDGDSGCFNVVVVTQKDAINQIKTVQDHIDWKKLYKVHIDFDSIFDLFVQVTGEGRGRCANSYTILSEYNIVSTRHSQPSGCSRYKYELKHVKSD